MKNVYLGRQPILDDNSNTCAYEIIAKLKNYGIKIIATKVEDSLSYRVAKDFGCEWFEGYFFAESKIVENAIYEPSQAHILMRIQDTNIDELTKEFENPSL